MLSSLLFVQGAVAKKDFAPALTHFHIKDGKIQAYNGVLSICSPIALDLKVSPNAAQFVKALRGCSETVALSMTAGGRLAVKSGGFKAFIDCYPSDYPEIVPTGKRLELTPEFMEVLKILAPIVAEDASRQWARGILFRGQSMFATNNVVLVERWLGQDFPLEMNLPLEAVKELLRIGVAPQALLAEENAVTFLFPEGRWLRTQLYTTRWPDVTRVLKSELPDCPPALTVGQVEQLLPFVDDMGRIYLLDGRIATSRDDGCGAVLEIPELHEGGVYNAQMLLLALPLATNIDFTSYPDACCFTGNKLRGAIIGIRS